MTKLEDGFRLLKHLTVVICALGSLLPPIAFAEPNVTLQKGYAVVHPFVVAEGYFPNGELTQLSNQSLYGTNTYGGVANVGTVYAIAKDGTVTVIKQFTGGSDGVFPGSGVIQASDGFIYGTTIGSSSERSTIYRLKTDGSKYKVIHRFSIHKEGSYPTGNLVEGPDNRLYGTLIFDGPRKAGSVVAVTYDGVTEVIHAFNVRDGAGPNGKLTRASDGKLYGATLSGGEFGFGTVFSIDEALNVSTVHSFTMAECNYPNGGLIEVAGVFYGTCAGGGAFNKGSVFSMTPAGDVSILHHFAGAPADGRGPLGSVTLNRTGTVLYGTTTYGGLSDNGTLFRIGLTGSYELLKDFCYCGGHGDGYNPYTSLTLVKDVLYGTTTAGMSTLNAGGVFRFK